MKYKQYWKSEFQAALTSICNRGVIKSWEEVSTAIQSDEITINEFVYRINLRHPSAAIIIFSSVDKATERTRDIGSDAVRIIYEWNTKNGIIYSRIKKRLRIDTLFENIQESIDGATEYLSDLKQLKWGTLAEALS